MTNSDIDIFLLAAFSWALLEYEIVKFSHYLQISFSLSRPLASSFKDDSCLLCVSTSFYLIQLFALHCFSIWFFIYFDLIDVVICLKLSRLNT